MLTLSEIQAIRARASYFSSDGWGSPELGL